MLKVVAFIGFALAAFALIALLRHLPHYQRLREQVRPVKTSERRKMITIFLRRHPIPADLADQAPALAQLYYGQRYAALSCVALLILITSLTATGGDSGWTAVLSASLALTGLVLSATQALAGWRYLHQPASSHPSSSRPSAP